ncbi:MAG: glycyl-radical enzyme activating protein [Clostridia bacterium]|nr:glycyl-radical enzyme activating protein [Clostridia bacterium]
MSTDPKAVTGTVFNIQRMSVNDGPGIRTIVFLKGCPLRCLWCHNPESQSARPELFYVPARCIGCGECVKVCPSGVHVMRDGIHELDRTNCTVCFKCVDACVGALEISGRTMSAGEAVDEVKKDRLFYEKSGGGLTVSGGEPTFQADFTRALLSLARAEGINTCIETAGFCPEDTIKSLVPLVDLFLYDIKETDSARHREYTGAPLEPILRNLKVIDDMGAKTVIRCPVIPGFNDREEHFAAVGELASGLTNVMGIDVMAYHPLGESKAASVGKKYPLSDVAMPADETIARWISSIAAHTDVPVKRG